MHQGQGGGLEEAVRSSDERVSAAADLKGAENHALALGFEAVGGFVGLPELGGSGEELVSGASGAAEDQAFGLLGYHPEASIVDAQGGEDFGGGGPGAAGKKLYDGLDLLAAHDRGLAAGEIEVELHGSEWAVAGLLLGDCSGLVLALLLAFHGADAGGEAEEQFRHLLVVELA